MNDIQKQTLKAELSGIKAMIGTATGPASALNQTTFVVSGPVVNIPTLAMAAQAFRAQTDALERLAMLIDKIIDAS